jgi:hypothetical protein
MENASTPSFVKRVAEGGEILSSYYPSNRWGFFMGYDKIET